MRFAVLTFHLFKLVQQKSLAVYGEARPATGCNHAIQRIQLGYQIILLRLSSSRQLSSIIYLRKHQAVVGEVYDLQQDDKNWKRVLAVDDDNIWMYNYKIESKKGEGTYSQVFMATSRIDGHKYALKVMKHRYANLQKIKKDKEIKALKTLSHPHIIKLIDVLYDSEEQKMALVFELMDCNLYELYKNKKAAFNLDKIRSVGHDILQATGYIHEKGLFHRDLKPENILVSGDREIKLADFGSCKNMHSSSPYTEYISTRWYRSPQCLLTDGYYSQKMDIWSIGCILFELYTQYPLFPGKNEVDQISTIFSILGTPSVSLMYQFTKKTSRSHSHLQHTAGIGLETLIPDAPEDFMDLLRKMLEMDPSKRIDAKQALSHSFFYSLTELKRYRKSLISRISEGKELSLPHLKSKKN